MFATDVRSIFVQQMLGRSARSALRSARAARSIHSVRSTRSARFVRGQDQGDYVNDLCGIYFKIIVEPYT